MINEIIPITTPFSKVNLYTYFLENQSETGRIRIRPVIIICPGGGYRSTSDREAESIAIRYNSMGFHACVLRYSVAPARFPVSLTELAQTVCYLRKNAERCNIDPNLIIVNGFSAGGHLAASLGTLWKEKFLEESLNTESADLKPNALVLCYPVITSGEFAHRDSFEMLLGEKRDELLAYVSLENRVSENTPPAFLWHTYEDTGVPVENSMLFASALRKHKIPFDLHIYTHGGHGLSLANEETMHPDGTGIQKECQNWIDMAGAWIRGLKD